jgi:heme/copper-type cytochrome/quinol oxidase subunit 2
MRVFVLGMCAVLAAGVFAAMLLSIWNTRHSANRSTEVRRGVVAELIWAAIPCVIVIAAAIPASFAIVTSR